MDNSVLSSIFFKNLDPIIVKHLVLLLPIPIVYREGENLYFNKPISDLLSYSNLEIQTLSDWEKKVTRSQQYPLKAESPEVLTLFRKDLSPCFVEVTLYKQDNFEFWVLHDVSSYLQKQELYNSPKKAEVVFSTLVETLSGTILDGKYRLEHKIGKGGYGVVYQATQLTLQRPVAIKVFQPTNISSEAQENLNRFRLEGLSACRVNHPNAVSILDYGISQEGIVYLVMELLDGNSLATELDLLSTLPIKRCLEILIPTCQALAEAHRVGIIHRDIKPDNIFLHSTAQGEIVKIVDFGIAKFLDYKNQEISLETITEQGTIIGTPTYMSPERLSNMTYDGRSDIYSMGVLFYQMLSGNPPFEIGAGTIFSLAIKHLSENPRPLSEIDPNIPLEVENIVMSMLRKEVFCRPTAEQLWQELQRLLNSLPEKELNHQYKKKRGFTFFKTQTTGLSEII